MLANLSTCKLVINRTMPLTLGVFAIMLVQLVDAVFIGKLGVNELAVHGMMLPFQAGFIGLQVGVGVAATSIIACAIGAKQQQKAAYVATSSLAFGVALVAMAALVLFTLSDWVFSLFAPDQMNVQQFEQLHGIFNQYWVFWLLSAVSVAFLYLLTCIYRANGDTKIVGIMFAAASVINLILDPILIFGLKMGITGAAVATSIGYLSCAGFMVMKAKRLSWFSALYFSPQTRQYCAELVRMAIATILNQILPSACAFITLMLIASMGTDAMAFWSLLARLESFMLVFTLALTMSVPPMIGRYLGANERVKIVVLLKAAFQIIIAIHLAMTLVLLLGAQTLTAVMTQDPALQLWLKDALWLMSLSYAPLGICMLVASVFNALRVPKLALLVSFSRLFILYIPALWLGTASGDLFYVIVAAMCANILAGAFAWFKLNTYIRKSIKKSIDKNSSHSTGTKVALEETVKQATKQAVLERDISTVSQ
ncbi:MATE family efflux transporter [Photobacterium swingsii]|uniref:MATE family efflux transporter n=1 Tax=Photobacterium swingsii TaxID=680026 RepID=UPI004068B5E6